MASPRKDLLASSAILALPFAASLLSALLHRPFLGDALRYGLFQLTLALLPSYALGRAFFRNTGFSVTEYIGLGYPALLGVFISLFWAGALVGQPLLPLALLPLSAWAIWDLLCRARVQGAAPRPSLTLQGAVYSLCVAITFGFFIFMLPPEEGQQFFLYKDFSLAIGKTWTMVRFLEGQPLIDFRLLGVPYSYHLTQFSQQAFAYKVTGASPYPVAFFLEPCFTWFYLILGMFAGARRLAGLTSGQTMWAVLLVIFCSSMDYYGWQNYQLFGAPLTYPFGFGSFLLFVFYCWGVLTDKLSPLNPLYFAMLYMAAACTKSVLGVVLPLALVPVFMLRVFERKTTWRDWLAIPLFVLAVAWLKFTMYNVTDQALFKDKGVAGFLMDSFDALQYLLRSPEPVFLVALAALDRVFRLRLYAHRHFFIFSATFIGICVTLPAWVLFAGGAEYFLWYSRALLLLHFALAAAYVCEKRQKARAIIVGLIALYGVVALYRMPIHDELKELAGLPRVSQKHIDPTSTLDFHEWAGLNWAAANLPHGALALTNRMDCFYLYLRSGQWKQVEEAYYDYLALTGLQGYSMPTGWLPQSIKPLRDERLKKVRAFVDGTDPEAQAKILRDVGFQYFLQCLRFEQKSYDNIPGLRKIYSNPSLAIYKVE